MRAKRGLNLFVAAAVLMIAAPGLSHGQSFAGKSITVINGFSPGGGSDTITRTFARHWKNHVPGAPTMVVRNMPGAGGSIALNFIAEKAPNDGLTLILSPWNPVGWVLGAPGTRSDYKSLKFIGGGSVAKIAYIRAGSGIRNANELKSAGQVRLSGSRPTSNFDILNRAPSGYSGSTTLMSGDIGQALNASERFSKAKPISIRRRCRSLPRA